MILRFQNRLNDAAARAYREADRRTGGIVGVLDDAIRRFGECQASDAAAAMAYYTLFSLFPLSLFLIAAGSLVLDSEYVYEQTVGFVGQLLPNSGQLIEGNIRQVIALRGPVGLVGLAGLLWSGLGVFRVVAQNVARAWPRARARSYLGNTALALKMFASLAGLLGLSLASNGIASLLPRLQIPLLGSAEIYGTTLWPALAGMIPWLFSFLMFFGLYRWVPNADVAWREAAWGAAVAALGWQAAFRGFEWYVASGLGRYEVVYGSVGAVVALLFWVYLSSVIALLGAHLSAAIGRRKPAR